jgi:Lrp/AsnC family transcriptional regulator for asnA, asnC and gidA
MAAKLNLDKLDLQIIHHMMEDAQISYADLGKKLFVSGGTIHVRIKNSTKPVSLKVRDSM